MEVNDESIIKYKKISTDDERQFEIIKGLVTILELKDKCTAGHSEAVTAYCMRFAEFLELPKEDIRTLKYAAILHDIGKVGIIDSVLNKNGRLDDNEFDAIKSHPSKGSSVIRCFKVFEKEDDIILHHHERIDGSGYPDGLKGGELSILTKILSICDSFDAMTSDRPYRNGLSFTAALDELEKNAGTQFDVELVEKFRNFVLSSAFQSRIRKGAAAHVRKHAEAKSNSDSKQQCT